MTFELTGVQADNLRGYRSTYLPIDRDVSVVVGPNNAGKTSILRILDWFLNGVDPSVFKSEWELPTDVAEFILPARETKHRARRLTLSIRVLDGRAHRKYKCSKDGVAILRLNVRLSPYRLAYLALGNPSRKESPRSDANAVDLLTRLQEALNFFYVPSFRDVSSVRFKSTLKNAYLSRLVNKVSHHQQGGAPQEYRSFKRQFDSIKSMLERFVEPLWSDMNGNLPRGLAREGAISLNCDTADLVDVLLDKFSLKVSTGKHDSSLVQLDELGSGLQSLLDLAVNQSGAQQSNNRTVLVVEEPESFLHPSAQRVLTRSLLSRNGVDKVVITTHSPTVVDESGFDQVVICKDHHFYFPKIDSGARVDINTALLNGKGSEMLFASSVLLVEGESDRLFFEWLRRRLAEHDASGRMDKMFVVDVGGKASFAPWIRVLESYGTPSDRPISWLVLADGDASSAVRRAFQDAKYTLPQPVLEKISPVAASVGGEIDQWVVSIRSLNKTAITHGVPFLLAPVDLEHTALSSAGAGTLQVIADAASCQDSRLETVLKKLGSKACERNDSAMKSPWVRGLIAKTLPGTEISSDVRRIMRYWGRDLLSSDEMNKLFKAL
ncbi:AAA family ATPase [Oleiagrimonas citrea]|uniref:AAA family ATPase n=1 Tax=Oleiagrimonas citrea TaxID=1665687 RepID=A0A846ZKV3_9GAMM|nr:AAA family ATPase [Oleiagrimonas citrea]NKZ38432.1 AAA family ATPase [Oleiagrimonas citrea]